MMPCISLGLPVCLAFKYFLCLSLQGVLFLLVVQAQPGGSLAAGVVC